MPLRSGNIMKIRFSEHSIQRCEESNVNWRSLAKEVSGLNFTGKIRWMTKDGVVVMEQTKRGVIVVKTFIAKHKFKGKQYHRGCYTR